MSIKSSFNYILNFQSREVTLTRPLTPTDLVVTVKMAPSDYFRNLETMANTVSKGREFVVSKDALDTVSFPRPKRGDRITDGENGTHTITEVREMADIGGATMGYRIRTG